MSVCARVLFASLMIISTASSADARTYSCIIKEELWLNDNGEMRPYPNKLEVGKHFVIDRTTGSIVGDAFINRTARYITVITQGDKDRNFEVLSASGDLKAQTDLIIVREWKKSSLKPFIALSSGAVFSGVCR